MVFHINDLVHLIGHLPQGGITVGVGGVQCTGRQDRLFFDKIVRFIGVRVIVLRPNRVARERRTAVFLDRYQSPRQIVGRLRARTGKMINDLCHVAVRTVQIFQSLCAAVIVLNLCDPVKVVIGVVDRPVVAVSE